MRRGWRNSGLSYYTLRKFLLPGFWCVMLPSLTVGLLTPIAVAHGSVGDRGKRSQQVERTAAADPRVVVFACTLSGSFTVRSWNRNEVRVRISDGVDLELTRIDQTKSEQATELRVTVKGRRPATRASCLMFGDMEIDVPRGAGVKLQTTSGDINVTDVARANVTTTSGRITLTKMREETSASVISGDLSVRDSTGSFKLHSIGGTVDARDLAPVAASDTLSASTVSGEVTFNHVQHQRVSVNSVSGEATYSGELLANGSYNFQSLSGEVRLSVPAGSSFRLMANVGESVKINSDFDLKYTENRDVIPPGNRSGPRRVSATFGAGEALIKVSMLSGSLRISKQ
jgi:Putative adhesin